MGRVGSGRAMSWFWSVFDGLYPLNSSTHSCGRCSAVVPLRVRRFLCLRGEEQPHDASDQAEAAVWDIVLGEYKRDVTALRS